MEKRFRFGPRFGRFVPRFGLRSLMLAIAVVSLACGYYAWNAKHYAAIKELLHDGNSVQWKRESPNWLDNMMGVYRFDSVKRVEFNNPFSSIAPVADLNSLEEFRSDLQVDDFPPLIPHAEALRVFSMYDVPPEAGMFLKKTTNLREFSGNTWKDIDLEWLTGNRKLKVLYVTNSTGLEHLAKFTELEYLQAPQELSSLEAIRGMSNLEHLEFSGSRVSSLEPLKDLKKLKFVGFEEVSVPQDEIDAYLKSLPKDVNAYGSYLPFEPAK